MHALLSLSKDSGVAVPGCPTCAWRAEQVIDICLCMQLDWYLSNVLLAVRWAEGQLGLKVSLVQGLGSRV